MTSPIRPFERKPLNGSTPSISSVTTYAPPAKQYKPRAPRAKREPKAKPVEEAVMSPNTAWLNASADYWLARNCTLLWQWDALTKRYVGFRAVAAGRGVVAEVKLVDIG